MKILCHGIYFYEGCFAQKHQIDAKSVINAAISPKIHSQNLVNKIQKIQGYLHTSHTRYANLFSLYLL